TGLTPSAIRLIEPAANELETAGAEHFVFIRAEHEEDTAVLSTLLQTAMATTHLLPRPSPEEQADGIAKYKLFGFAQSLDIVGRWYYQLADAEKINKRDTDAREGQDPRFWPIESTPLYWYRAPGHNRRLFPDFFGPGAAGPSCGCEDADHPDPNCIFF